MKSVIRGEGFGSRHAWRKFNGPINPIVWERYSIYQCITCGECFKHEYRIVSDIFEAMRRAGIREGCTR